MKAAVASFLFFLAVRVNRLIHPRTSSHGANYQIASCEILEDWNIKLTNTSTIVLNLHYKDGTNGSRQASIVGYLLRFNQQLSTIVTLLKPKLSAVSSSLRLSFKHLIRTNLNSISTSHYNFLPNSIQLSRYSSSTIALTETMSFATQPFPFVAAHRGFKSKYAENTIVAFQAAVDAGVSIIETDVQITNDGIVVINHDPNTGRNYNQDLVIGETKLEDLKQLSNLQDKSQKIATFKELLEWFLKADYETEKDLKLMLDIKVTNSKTVLVKIISDLLSIKNDSQFWRGKVIFGLWSLEFYEFGVATQAIKGFEIINITLSPCIALAFYKYSQTLPKEFQLSAVSLLNVATLTPEFQSFHETEVLSGKIGLYLWTVNEPIDLTRAVYLKATGIITDKADVMVDLIKRYGSGELTIPDDERQIKALTRTKWNLTTYEGVNVLSKIIIFRVFEVSIFYNLVKYNVVKNFLGFLRSFIF